MPLMMCPNCHVGMKEISRENVLIDMCPQCNGVWLDRGELQKLLEVNRQEQVGSERQYQPEHSASYRQDDRQHHDKYRKKSKMESIFDIFD